MSHSVIYVLFKSSKKAAPGIEINTVKDHYIYIYTYIQSKKVQGIHTHAIFGARVGNSPMVQMAARPPDYQENV